jgi:hypothetical protein
MAMIGGLVCGRFGTTRAGRDWFGEDIREGEGRLFGFTLEGYPEVITLALITVIWKSHSYPVVRSLLNGSVERSSASFSSSAS